MTFFKKLFYLLSSRDRKLLMWLVCFSIFISIIETIGISVIMPFIQVATDSSVIETNKYFSLVYSSFKFQNKDDFIILFGIVLIVFYIFRGIVNYFYFYVLASYSQGRYKLISSQLFNRFLKMPYKIFTKYNSSSLSKVIISEAQLLTSLLMSLLIILSEVFIIIFIYTVIILVNFNITFYLTLLLGLNAFFMIKIISPKIKDAGKDRAKFQEYFYEIINKSFGNYKMIKLHSLEKNVGDEFIQMSNLYTKSNIKNQSLSNFPRIFLEVISFTIIIGITISLIWSKDNNSAGIVMSQVSIFVMALYRLMPSINRIMTSYNQILFNHKALDIIYDNMQFPNEELGNKSINFFKELTLSNIEFKYTKENTVLENINLVINKNEKVAIVGESGSGKSTLVDLLIGLNKPTSGKISIDDTILTDENLVSWREKVGYIPQLPYLFDGTVGENISFGLEYNLEKIIACLKQAQIYEVFNKKDLDKTKIGENGITLSGGQKQRIAIARALYKDPEILVLDEATSALDYKTENNIMQEIYNIGKYKTLIIIAHRLSAIQGCDKIIKLENGKIVNIEEKKGS